MIAKTIGDHVIIFVIMFPGRSQRIRDNGLKTTAEGGEMSYIEENLMNDEIALAIEIRMNKQPAVKAA